MGLVSEHINGIIIKPSIRAVQNTFYKRKKL